jgi:hypothetical protein
MRLHRFVASNQRLPLCRRFQALRADRWNSGMNASLGLTVRAQVLQHIVDRVLEAGTGFVGSTYALRYELANFKAVHSLRENAVDFLRTHVDSGKQVIVAWEYGARQKRYCGSRNYVGRSKDAKWLLPQEKATLKHTQTASQYCENRSKTAGAEQAGLTSFYAGNR